MVKEKQITPPNISKIICNDPQCMSFRLQIIGLIQETNELLVQCTECGQIIYVQIVKAKKVTPTKKESNYLG